MHDPDPNVLIDAMNRSPARTVSGATITRVAVMEPDEITPGTVAKSSPVMVEHPLHHADTTSEPAMKASCLGFLDIFPAVSTASLFRKACLVRSITASRAT